MASLALYSSHLVLHPQLTRALKVLSTTVGRDKTYRLIQYFARLLAWHYLRTSDSVYKTNHADKWTALKAGLATLRKGLRIGKPLEHLQTAVKLSAQMPRSISAGGGAAEMERVLQVARQMAYAGYLGSDTFLYLQSIKFLTLPADRVARINLLSQRCWLGGIALSLASTAAGVLRVKKESNRLALVGEEKEGGVQVKKKALVAQQNALMSQATLDALDFFIPANNLGYVNLSEGTVGAIGTFTSFLALQSLWAKAA